MMTGTITDLPLIVEPAKRWGQENPGPIFLPPFSCLSFDFVPDFHGFVTWKDTEVKNEKGASTILTAGFAAKVRKSAIGN